MQMMLGCAKEKVHRYNGAILSCLIGFGLKLKSDEMWILAQSFGMLLVWLVYLVPRDHHFLSVEHSGESGNRRKPCLWRVRR